MAAQQEGRDTYSASPGTSWRSTEVSTRLRLAAHVGKWFHMPNRRLDIRLFGTVRIRDPSTLDHRASTEHVQITKVRCWNDSDVCIYSARCLISALRTLKALTFVVMIFKLTTTGGCQKRGMYIDLGKLLWLQLRWKAGAWLYVRNSKICVLVSFRQQDVSLDKLVMRLDMCSGLLLRGRPWLVSYRFE